MNDDEDDMTWARIDDQFYDHPSIVGLDLALIGLWVCGIAYSNKHLTDGRIPVAQVQRFGSSATESIDSATRLVAAGRWTFDGSNYWIVGYLDHNPSREQVLAMRALKSDAARRGGQTRWQKGQMPDSKQGAKQAASSLLGAKLASVGSAPVAPLLSSPLHSNDQDTSTDPSGSAVREVYDHWAHKSAAANGCSPAKYKLTDKRRGKVKARLADGYSVADLKLAIDGCFKLDYNVSNGYTDLELICRDATKTDRYIAAAKGKLSTSGSQTSLPPKPTGKAYEYWKPSPEEERLWREGRSQSSNGHADSGAEDGPRIDFGSAEPPAEVPDQSTRLKAAQGPESASAILQRVLLPATPDSEAANG